MSEVVERLDDWGLPAWITVMVLGFVIFWPVGLAVLAYLIWSGRMGCGAKRRFGRWGHKWKEHCRGENTFASRSGGRSGNAAFDEYREETLRRLEEEEREFQTFLERLRFAKDRAEFDQFMNERKARGSDQSGNGGNPGGPADPSGGAVPQTP